MPGSVIVTIRSSFVSRFFTQARPRPQPHDARSQLKIDLVKKVRYRFCYNLHNLYPLFSFRRYLVEHIFQIYAFMALVEFGQIVVDY